MQLWQYCLLVTAKLLYMFRTLSGIDKIQTFWNIMMPCQLVNMQQFKSGCSPEVLAIQLL